MSENLVPDLCRTKEQIRAVAEEQGLICIFPDADELQLDIDQPLASYGADAERRITTILRNNSIEVIATLQTTSKSGNLHVYLKLDTTLEHIERIVLQAAMGSDPVRETLCLLRARAGSEAPIALFETSKGAKEVFAWRRCWNA